MLVMHHKQFSTSSTRKVTQTSNHQGQHGHSTFFPPIGDRNLQMAAFASAAQELVTLFLGRKTSAIKTGRLGIPLLFFDSLIG